MKFVGLSFGILVENETVLLIYTEEWLHGIIIRLDYIIMQLLCLNLTYYASIMLDSFGACYAKNYANIFNAGLFVCKEKYLWTNPL